MPTALVTLGYGNFGIGVFKGECRNNCSFCMINEVEESFDMGPNGEMESKENLLTFVLLYV